MSLRRAVVGLLVCLVSLVWAGSALAASVVVSEFRFRGPSGGNDEFVELKNASGSSVDVSGWAIEGCNSSGFKSIRATIPSGTTLDAGAHYLFANASTSGGPYSGTATGDRTYSTGITDTGGVRLLDDHGAVVDAAGTTTTTPECREGAGLASLGSTNADRSYARLDGGSRDTGDNAADFEVISPSRPQNLSGDEVAEREIVPIGEVQGSVSGSDDGTSHVSPSMGEEVLIQGVVTQRVLARTSGGGSNHGFHIQNTTATADSDPTTSDGIFVFIGRFSTLRRDGGGFYLPEVGDEVVLRGPVTEFFGLTQLSNPFLVSVVRDGVLLDVEVPALEVDPPADLADANRWWERREGMRAQVPAGSLAIQKRDVFASTLDGEVWVVRGDSDVAQRSDPYARRAFRDPHPLDDVPAQLFDNGNGYRIMMGSLGLKGATGDNRTLIAPARTFDTMTNAPVGGIYFSFGKYSVQVGEQPALVPGVDPASNAPPVPPVRDEEWAAATLNVENLYDFRDDPHDGCDFAGDAGCPGVRPPFDYVPASAEAYQAHVAELAQQVAVAMEAPDIVLVQEAEDQDICTVAAGALACGTTDDADGKPDTLQELALAIAAVGGPAYDAAYDRDGADDRGIVSAFLYRTDRVELLAAHPDDPVLGSSPQVVYDGEPKAYNADVENPKVLNADLPDRVDTSTGTDGSDVFTRAPQVAHFRIWREAVGVRQFLDVYAVSNHFSSTPDRRVGQRTEQARYNARIFEAIDATVGVPVLVGGDLNVFPRPDDPFAPGHPLFPSDQLGPLYDAGLDNLHDALVERYPSSAYTYTFQGQAQTLDQLFVSGGLGIRLADVRVAHVNADWPADHEGDGPRGASDHDPVVARFGHLPTRAGGARR